MKIKNLLKLLVLSAILSITISAMEELGNAQARPTVDQKRIRGV